MGNGPAILHICNRESIRPLRDQILKSNGYAVESCGSAAAGLDAFSHGSFALVLIDIENERQAREAETLCEQVKKLKPEQLVMYACSWRVSVDSSCPDEVVHSEFSPEKFLAGVRELLPPS